MRAGGIRVLLPLYMVVFVGFLGYSLMIATFTPMILRDDNGMLPKSSSLAQRSLVLGILLALYALGQFLGSPVLGALTTAGHPFAAGVGQLLPPCDPGRLAVRIGDVDDQPAGLGEPFRIGVDELIA